MFPGKRAAIMLNPLSLPTAPYIVGNRFLSPSVSPTRLESDVAYVLRKYGGTYVCCTAAIVSFAILYSSWLTTAPWAILVPR